MVVPVRECTVSDPLNQELLYMFYCVAKLYFAMFKCSFNCVIYLLVGPVYFWSQNSKSLGFTAVSCFALAAVNIVRIVGAT